MSNKAENERVLREKAIYRRNILVGFCGRLTYGALTGYLVGKFFTRSMWYLGGTILLISYLHYMDWV